jgi:hypothetical protein
LPVSVRDALDPRAGEVGDDAHVRRRVERLPVAAAELRGGRPALEPGGEHVARGEPRHDRPAGQRGVLLGVEDGVAALEPVARAGHVGLDLGERRGPLDPARDLARLEVDRIERDAASAPEVRRPPELAADRDGHRVVGGILVDGRGEGLHRGIEPLAAGLDEQDLVPRRGELERADDAGGPGADDGDRGREDRAVGERPCVDPGHPRRPWQSLVIARTIEPSSQAAQRGARENGAKVQHTG